MSLKSYRCSPFGVGSCPNKLLAPARPVAPTAAPAAASKFLLVIFAMIFVPFSLCFASCNGGRLRVGVVVNHAGLNLEEQHHGVIFVNRVVAVHGPVPLEVAE